MGTMTDNRTRRRLAWATLPLGGLKRMPLPTRGWYTVQEAAVELGVTDSYVRRLIRHDEIAAEPIGARGYQIMPQAVEDYQRTGSGGQGWDKRKAEDYTPSRAARWARDYRVRKKREREVAQEAPTGSQPVTGGVERE